MRIATAVLLAACVLALTACGASSSSAGDFQGEEKAVAEAVEDIQDAGKANDATKLCKDLLAQAFVRRVEVGGGKCADELDDALNDADDAELEVTDVTISGTSARALVKGSGSNKDRRAVFQFVREGGRWRASAISTDQAR